MTLPVPSNADFDRRWAEWLERGRAHDLRVAARLRVALPVLAAIAGLGLYLVSR
jgi:hypothetical protein